MLLTATVITGYLLGVRERGDVEHGRAIALAVLILASAMVTLALGRLGTLAGVLIPGATLVVSAALIQAAPVAHALGLAPLHVDDWVMAALGALVATLPLASVLGRRPGSGARSGTSAPHGKLTPVIGVDELS